MLQLAMFSVYDSLERGSIKSYLLSKFHYKQDDNDAFSLFCRLIEQSRLPKKRELIAKHVNVNIYKKYYHLWPIGVEVLLNVCI